MFEIRLIYGDKDLETLCLKCIHCKKETGLNSETNFTWVYDKVITKFLLNKMLHHVGMSWIIISNQEMEYYMTTKNNHLDWLNKGPWYNKNICYKLHGIKFEDFITQAKLFTLFDENTFRSTFYDSRRFRVPFIGRKGLNGSVEFIRYSDVTSDSASDIISTQNIFIHSWGKYPTMIWPTCSNW